jgi:hypothetical protein
MAESDSESRFDELERDNLQKVISEVEAAQAASRADKKPMLDHFLQNARGRVAVLDKRIKESKAENESRHQAEVAVAVLAAKETALSTSEKETYSGFLAKEFFTKKDFGSLEKFYSQTWDRLSESGKAEMSHRIWEGIRRDEYKFTDLPKVVQEKEAERAYYVLKKRETGTGKASNIPETDREDFIRAYESGKREEAKKILERESFRMNMFVNETTVEKRDVAANKDKESERSAFADNVRSQPSGKAEQKVRPDAASMGELDFSSVNLGGMKVADDKSAASPAGIPRANGSAASEGKSVRSS